MKITRRTLLGTIAAGFAAGPPSCVRRGRLAVADRAAGVALRGGRGKRHLVAYPGRAVRAQPQPAVHRREQAGRGHPRRQRLVSRAAPDGYTFLYAAAPFATAEALFEKLNYNRKDLQPVAMAMLAPLFLVVNAQAPFKTLQEMIDYGRSKPEGLTFGSPGAGSQPHLAAELLFRDAGVKGLIVPFRGDNMAYTSCWRAVSTPR
jgi:hypothetical protein